MDAKKLIITLMVVVVMLAGVGVGVYLVRQQQDIREKAAPATTVSLLPLNAQPNVGETFTVLANIDTGENSISAVSLYLNFDPVYLEAVDVALGAFFDNPQVVGPSYDNDVGEVTYFLLIPLSSTPVKGNGTLARFSFKAKKEGTSSIIFAERTNAGATREDQNAIVSKIPTTINILSAGSTGGTNPTSTPTSTPRPTATTAPGIGGGPTNTPTSTPTSTPSPTVTTAAGVGGGESTNTPTTRIVNPTTGETVDTLPDSGVSMPVVLGIAIGLLTLLGSFALLL